MAEQSQEKDGGDHKKRIGGVSPKPPRKKDTTEDSPKLENVIPVHKKLSDVGQFSFAALCGTILHTLFENEQDNKFKEETLAIILIALEQPQQVCESVRAMCEGQGLDDMDPYIDILLAEEVLQDGAEPVISELLALAISKGCYDARMRVMIKHLAWRLKVGWDTVSDLEMGMSETLALAQYELSDQDEVLQLLKLEEKMEKAKKAKRSKYKRYALIGLATVGGGTLIGLTGGLAAPLVAAGAGAIIGGAGAAVLGSTAGVAIIGSLFGAAGAGLTGYKMKRRVGAIEEFEFEPLVSGSGLRAGQALTNQLHISIAVTGWLTNEHKDVKQPWRNLAESKEQYALRYETKYLVTMGEALDYIFNSAMTMATQEALKYTVLNTLLAAVAWPSALLSASNLIDNPWSVALQRSQAAGKALAEVLLSREQGNRPVTLIGFSLGARVLFSCLEELSRRKGGEGIIEDVILLGLPATADPKVWAKYSHVVAGKIVNGYCRGDWLLKFLYRTSSAQLSIAGLRPVKWADRRMHNIDLSDVVHGHLDYKKQLDTIMKAVGVQTWDDASSKKSSPKKTKASKSTEDLLNASMEDLSSSDEEMFEKGAAKVEKTPMVPVGPVILEDYSPDGEGRRSKSGSVQSGGEAQPISNVLPESASFDSGVVINVAEPENKDKIMSSEDTSHQQGSVDSSIGATAIAGASDTVTDKVSDILKVHSSTSAGESKGDPMKSESSKESNKIPAESGDRVGDAGSDDHSLDTAETELREKEEDEETEVKSNLERKQMFDSMYRLVLDDDLMEMMNEDEEEGAVEASTKSK